ncbi:MAG TPA: hypothetical protein VIY28_04595 [Pseudonocardiaceae bacterium]
MVRDEPQRDRPGSDPDAEERRWLDDELIGLDRDDPEVQAFSEHLDRARRQYPGFTVEGYLFGVTDFAESANRAQGLRRAAAVLVVALILLGVAITVWEVLLTLLG